MKRLLSLCLILIVTFSVIAFASRSVGRVQPVSQAVQYWHLTDCAPPCWAGITPSLTSIDEAGKRVEHQFSDFKLKLSTGSFQYWTREGFLTGTNVKQIGMMLDRGIVYRVFIFAVGKDDFIVETMPTLGDLDVLFGPPECLVVNANLGYLILYYKNGAGQVLQTTVKRLFVTEPVDSIEMYPSLSSLGCQGFGRVAWRGFRSVDLYQADIQ